MRTENRRTYSSSAWREVRMALIVAGWERAMHRWACVDGGPGECWSGRRRPFPNDRSLCACACTCVADRWRGSSCFNTYRCASAVDAVSRCLALSLLPSSVMALGDTTSRARRVSGARASWICVRVGARIKGEGRFRVRDAGCARGRCHGRARWGLLMARQEIHRFHSSTTNTCNR